MNELNLKSDGNGLPVQFFQNLKAGLHQTVVVYGTSLSHTSEWPVALRAYFAERFPEQVTVVNRATSGQHSSWGLANLDSLVLSNKPDLVFIEFSINDSATKHNISVERGISNLDSMIKALREQNPQVDIVLQTMNTVWNVPGAPKQSASDRPNLDEYYESYREYAREHGLRLLDHHQTWLKLQREDEGKFKRWLPDGTHPIPEASLAVTWLGVEAFLEEASGG